MRERSVRETQFSKRDIVGYEAKGAPVTATIEVEANRFGPRPVPGAEVLGAVGAPCRLVLNQNLRPCGC